MIAVLVISNKPDKPVIKEDNGVLTSWKMTVHREIVNILLFESTTQFREWIQAEWQERYAGCDFEIHGVEDMRCNLTSFRPKCRHCKWFPKRCANAIRLYCMHPDQRYVAVDDHTSGCHHFEEGMLCVR